MIYTGKVCDFGVLFNIFKVFAFGGEVFGPFGFDLELFLDLMQFVL